MLLALFAGMICDAFFVSRDAPLRKDKVESNFNINIVYLAPEEPCPRNAGILVLFPDGLVQDVDGHILEDSDISRLLHADAAESSTPAPQYIGIRLEAPKKTS